MSESPEIYKYLDAKFEALETRIDDLKDLWAKDSAECAKERVELSGRMRKLEVWRGVMTGGIGVIGFFASGLLPWLTRVFFPPAAMK